MKQTKTISEGLDELDVNMLDYLLVKKAVLVIEMVETKSGAKMLISVKK